MDNEILDSGMIQQTPHQFAGFWIRVGASFVDLLILLPVYGLFAYGLYFQKSMLITILGLVLSASYKPILEATKSATFGKMAVKLKVVNEENKSISAEQSIIRNSPWLISSALSIATHFLLFQNSDFIAAEGFIEMSMITNESSLSTITSIFSFVFLIVVITVAFTAKKQGLHDMMADTYVVKTE